MTEGVHRCRLLVLACDQSSRAHLDTSLKMIHTRFLGLIVNLGLQEL